MTPFMYGIMATYAELVNVSLDACIDTIRNVMAKPAVYTLALAYGCVCTLGLLVMVAS